MNKWLKHSVTPDSGEGSGKSSQNKHGAGFPGVQGGNSLYFSLEEQEILMLCPKDTENIKNTRCCGFTLYPYFG